MTQIFFKTLLILIFAANINCFANNLSNNKNITQFNSDEGINLLETSKFKGDFYNLVNFYQPQINPLYCTAASAITILNALNYNNIPSQKNKEIFKPLSLGGGVFKANISRGGKGEAYDVDDEMEMLAIQVAKVLDLDIAGVDLLFHSDGYRICEANSAPGFEGFEKALDINVPQKVFDYAKIRCGV